MEPTTNVSPRNYSYASNNLRLIMFSLLNTLMKAILLRILMVRSLFLLLLPQRRMVFHLMRLLRRN